MTGTGAEFGGALRLERQRRGLTLEDLCDGTKIQLRHLEALESGELTALPGGVFRRGIVRAYLKMVGLEEAVWLSRFEASSAGLKTVDEQEAWATFAANVKRRRAVPTRSSTGRWLGVLLLLLVVAAAGWAVWRFALRPRVQPVGDAPRVQGVLAPTSSSRHA